jgi:hypothetical protein
MDVFDTSNTNEMAATAAVSMKRTERKCHHTLTRILLIVRCGPATEKNVKVIMPLLLLLMLLQHAATAPPEPAAAPSWNFRAAVNQQVG